MTDKQRFCLIPEAGLNVMPNGTITPCCVSNYKLGHISTDSLASVFHGEQYTEFRQAHRQGELPQTCLDNCVRKNNNFVHITGRNNLVREAEYLNLKSANQEKLILLDIGIGNICNLTCTFCDENWSSSWAKLKGKSSSIFSFDKDTILNIAEDSKNLTYISFKGGEPLNMPYLDEFLNIITSNNPHCQIDMVTNGTETNDRINQALFRNPAKTSISISTEATGKLYQYMRGGKYTWDNVLDNIKKFADLGCRNIHISSIISLYNYTTWVKDMLTIQKQISNLSISVSLGSQLCIYPYEQSIFLLNLEQRQRLANSIQTGVENGLLEYDVGNMTKSLIQGRPVPTTKEQVLANIEFNNKMRGMDLFSIVEDFTPYITEFAKDQH